MTTKQLTHHQVHWLECLSGFNYLIHYHAGWLGTKPDALTHHEDVYPWGENAYALANPLYCATTALDGYPWHSDKIHCIQMVTSLHICGMTS